MRLYNSLARKKEEFRPEPNKRVNLFVCGPTVYDLSHIGHARTFLIYDAFVKYARRRLGWNIFYLQNITNIDDKIIFRAKQEGKKFSEIADNFEQEYYKDMAALGINAVDKYARATDYIPEIISQVERLLAKGHVYKIENDGYYFDVTTFEDYGKLSGRTVQHAEDAVTRIDESINKKNKADFAVWKFSQNEEPGWESQLGYGRPGWHIEDTAITEKNFGVQYDLHGGAIELKFPHHEAEIAQMESISGKKPMVRIWMHAGLVDIGGEKMSKSKNNFVTIRDLLGEIEPETMRMFSFSSHYRSPVNYTEKVIKEAESRQKRLVEFQNRLREASLEVELPTGSSTSKAVDDQIAAFWQELEDDFNTPEALARLFELVTEANRALDEHKFSHNDAQKVSGFLDELNGIFNIIPIAKTDLPQEVRKLVAEREAFRKASDFEKADAVRRNIEEKGYEVKDTPGGSRVTKKNN